MLALDEGRTAVRDLAEDCFFFNSSQLGDDVALFLDFTEEMALSLSTKAVPRVSLGVVCPGSEAGVRDFSIKMSLS